jgi:adenylate cyclase
MTDFSRWRRFAGDAGAALPERVRRAILTEQQDSEIVISWVQMAVVATFAALYTFSRKTFMSDAPFAPVPWALAAYFAFTLLRLILAYRRALPGWFLSVSVVIDMALLMVTIWSFHLQYQQAPAFYLKAPTLLYVFIFIALRALRSEAGYVMLAGGVAAAGWLALVLYAAAFDPGGMPTTRNYVDYMTSAMILWGAEFDKIVSILMVTAVLSVALIRARRTLVRAVAEGAAASDLKRFFAPDIARRITGADERVRPGEGEIRDAATLFVDMRGFTRIASGLPPNALIALLAEYQARLVPVIQRHGGSIDKFLGDGIMASFGAARTSESFAADALRAVDDLLSEADAWRASREAAGLPAPRIGAAVAVGAVLFGAVGDETRLEYTVIGDAVNLAAKLEKHTKSARVRALATEHAFSLACAQGYAAAPDRSRLPQSRVAGVAEAVDLVVLG